MLFWGEICRGWLGLEVATKVGVEAAQRDKEAIWGLAGLAKGEAVLKSVLDGDTNRVRVNRRAVYMVRLE